MLDELEERLGKRRYLFGSSPVESDWRLFVTLVRFDLVYYVHFKCNLRLVAQYKNLSGYLRDLYQIDGIAETVDSDHIKRHYYVTHADINPTRIVPVGPLQDLTAPHGRERLVACNSQLCITQSDETHLRISNSRVWPRRCSVRYTA